MEAKSKFQISKLLDERIKKIILNCIEYEPDFENVSEAFILGFHSANVTNYVGLTTEPGIHHAGLQIVGMVFFKGPPDNILTCLEKVKQISIDQLNGSPLFEQDKNKHLFLTYFKGDGDLNVIDKKIFHITELKFLEEQPKLSILDESKLFNHSALTKFEISIGLNILDGDKKLLSQEDIEKELFRIKSLFYDQKEFKISLGESSISGSDDLLTESLYDQISAPNDVLQMSDYLPNMTKSDKEKLVSKWRNKIKSERSPLDIKLEHKHLILSKNQTSASLGIYMLNMTIFQHLHVNDSISKSIQLILCAIRYRLDLLKILIKSIDSLEVEELKFCTFKPTSCGHLISSVYPLASKPNHKLLKDLRCNIHSAYLLPKDKPQVRYSQRIVNFYLGNIDAQSGYLCNIHQTIKDNSGVKGGIRTIIEGTYTYHHYMQDRISDNGWGCAYRSLQTIISWYKHQGYIYSTDVELRANDKKDDKTHGLRQKLHLESRMPTHEEIQTVLVDVGDKQASFIGSEKWIGSQEVCYVLSHLYNLESKFISVSSGSELVYKARDLGQHFSSQSTPVMIGGGVLAHTIIGVDFNEKNGDVSYLILDPHYTGAEDVGTITKKGWCGWKKNSFWDKNAFYNMCLPQRPKEY